MSEFTSLPIPAAPLVDHAEAVKTALNIRWPNLPSTFVTLGDSLTLDTNEGRNQFDQANFRLGKKGMIQLGGAGVSGNRTDQMFARIQTDVIAHNPGFCIVLGGINDILQDTVGRTNEQIIASLLDIYNALDAAGIRVVTCTIPPCANTVGLQSGSSFSSPQRIEQINRWIKITSIQRGYPCADFYAATVDPASATRNPRANTTLDGLHQSALGGYLWGYQLFQALESVLPHIDIGPSSNGEPGNYDTNALMSGNSGGLATGWVILPYGTAVGTPTKVARTDGIAGEWQQISVTGADGAFGNRIEMQRAIIGMAALAGQTCVAEIEVEIDPGATQINSIAYEVTAGGVGRLAGNLVSSSGAIAWGQSAPLPSRGIFRTRPFVVTGAGFNGSIYLRLIISANATVRFSRSSLRLA